MVHFWGLGASVASDAVRAVQLTCGEKPFHAPPGHEEYWVLDLLAELGWVEKLPCNLWRATDEGRQIVEAAKAT